MAIQTIDTLKYFINLPNLHYIDGCLLSIVSRKLSLNLAVNLSVDTLVDIKLY